VQVLVTSHSPTAWNKQVDELECGCCLAAGDSYSLSHKAMMTKASKIQDMMTKGQSEA